MLLEIFPQFSQTYHAAHIRNPNFRKLIVQPNFLANFSPIFANPSCKSFYSQILVLVNLHSGLKRGELLRKDEQSCRAGGVCFLATELTQLFGFAQSSNIVPWSDNSTQEEYFSEQENKDQILNKQIQNVFQKKKISERTREKPKKIWIIQVEKKNAQKSSLIQSAFFKIKAVTMLITRLRKNKYINM